MTVDRDPSAAAERTHLARLRTALLVCLVAALVARGTLHAHLAVSALSAVIAVVGLGLAANLRRTHTGPGAAALLSVSVTVLALLSLTLLFD